MLGIITKRDIKNFKFADETVSKYMTPREKMEVIEITIDPTDLDSFKEEEIGQTE